MSRGRGGWLVAASFLAGCVRPPVEQVANGWPAYVAPSTPSAKEIVTDLSRLRGLPLDAAVNVELVDDQAFVTAYHASHRSAKRRPGEGAAYFAAFGMTSWIDVDTLSEKMRDEGLVGFYARTSKRLYVRRRDPHRALSRLDLIAIAHEAEHALQDRFFDLSQADAFDDEDQALAWNAVIEGDATLASLVLAGKRSGLSPAESIARLEKRAGAHDVDFLQGSGIRLAEDAPPLLRAQLAWPYVGGLDFVARLAESGGWALVNAAMRNPPQTTEQVLHIEKYIAGEGPIEVRTPASIDGYAYVERGRMGELQTRLFLAECLADPEAASAASGWGGDAFAIVARGTDRALLWSTAWDDAEAAARFEAGLEARRACEHTGEKQPFSAVRDGSRVAFVQGLSDEAARRSAATQLLALVGRTPAPVPPLGPVHLRSAPIAAYIEDSTLGAAGRRSKSPLDITVDLNDLHVHSKPGVDFFASGRFGWIGAEFVWAPPSSALMDAQVAELVEEVSKHFGGAPVLDGGTRRVHLSWTDADERALRIGNVMEVRLAFAPACSGRTTIVLITSWKSGTPGAADAARWSGSVRPRVDEDACQAVSALLDPAAVQ